MIENLPVTYILFLLSTDAHDQTEHIPLPRSNVKVIVIVALMGCDTSKASTRQDADVTNNNSDVFTENQIDTLRSTWPLLARNLKANGIRVFRLVFLTEPSTRYVFKSVR